MGSADGVQVPSDGRRSSKTALVISQSFLSLPLDVTSGVPPGGILYRLA